MRATALYEVKRTLYAKFGLQGPLPGDFRSNDVISGHLKSLTSFSVM